MSEPVDDYDPAAEAVLFAERAVLGSVLVGVPVADALCGLRHSDFTGLRCDIARALLAHQGSPLHATHVSAMIPGAGRAHMLELVECEGAASSTARVNLPSHAHTVERASVTREVREQALHLTNGAADNPGDIISRISAAVSRSSGLGWASNDTDLLEFLARDYPEPPALIGGGLLARGDLAILYGRGGLGKSYLALQLSLSLARGNPWLGLPGPERTMRVGYVARELIGYRLQQRMRHLIGVEGSTEDDRNVRLISLTDMTRRPDLLDPHCVADAVAWAKHRELDLMILDPLARFHAGSEVEDAPALMASCDEIRARTECAVMLVHHERKPPSGSGRESEDDQDALRGHTVFRDMPTVLFRLTEKSGHKVLRVAKTNNAAEPSPIYLAHHASGHGFVVCNSPEQVGDANLERVRAVLIANPSGVGRATIESETGLARATIKRHLKALGVDQIGTYRAPVYRLIGSFGSGEGEPIGNLIDNKEID